MYMLETRAMKIRDLTFRPCCLSGGRSALSMSAVTGPGWSSGVPISAFPTSPSFKTPRVLKAAVKTAMRRSSSALSPA